MPTNCFGQHALAIEDCCRCGRPIRQQNALFQAIAGAERWFCVDCACALARMLAEDIACLVRVRQAVDRAHAARDAVHGEYAARRLMPGMVG